MENRYFLQVCRDKLTDYIMKAIICPDNLMGDECHIDTQSTYKDILLFSNGIINTLDKFEEVLVEIILTEEEISTKLKPLGVDGIYSTYMPFPISRIKKIYVQSDKEKKHLLKKIETNQKGFIPEGLVEIKNIESKFTLPKIKDMELEGDFSGKLNHYNKLLGMLAYMKNTEYYYADKNKSIKNYSSDYFSILGQWNTYIEAPKSDFLDSLKSTNIAKEFVTYLTQDKRADKKFIEQIINSTADETIKRYLEDLISDPLNKLDILDKLKNKEEDIYFYICMVYINSDKHSNKVSNLKELLNQQVPYEKAERTLAYLGYYYGYELLDAKEDIQIKDKYFKLFLQNGSLNTKFKLDNIFDYITIETIYQHVFNGDKFFKNDFEYLDFEFNKIDNIKEDEWYKKTILATHKDIEHYSVSKRTNSEYIIYKISKYQDTITSSKYISVFYNKYLAETKENSIDKNTFLEKINTTKILKKQENELLNAIEMDSN